MSCVCQEEEETSFHFLGKYLLQCFQDIPSSERIFCNRRFIPMLDQHSYGSQEPLRVFFIFGYIEDVHWANPECDLSTGQHKNLFAGPKIGNVRQEMGREKCERHFSIPRLPAT